MYTQRKKQDSNIFNNLIFKANLLARNSNLLLKDLRRGLAIGRHAWSYVTAYTHFRSTNRFLRS